MRGAAISIAIIFAGFVLYNLFLRPGDYPTDPGTTVNGFYLPPPANLKPIGATCEGFNNELMPNIHACDGYAVRDEQQVQYLPLVAMMGLASFLMMLLTALSRWQ